MQHGACTCGADGGIAGGTAGYGIGAWGGVPLLRRCGRKVAIDETRLDRRTREFFGERGSWADFAGRFIAFSGSSCRKSLPALEHHLPLTSVGVFTLLVVAILVSRARCRAPHGQRSHKESPRTQS